MSCSQALRMFAPSLGQVHLYLSVMLMPFPIRQRVWTIEWSIEQMIGEAFGKRGRRELFWHRTSLTWVVNAHVHPMYFDPHCFVANCWCPTFNPLLFGIHPAWPGSPLRSQLTQCTLPHSALPSIHNWSLLASLQLSYVKLACCPWEFAQKSQLYVLQSKLLVKASRSNMYPTDPQHQLIQHPQSYKDGKAEHRGSLKGA